MSCFRWLLYCSATVFSTKYSAGKNSISFVVFTLLTFFSFNAHAKIVEYEFNAQIDSILEYTAQSNTHLSVTNSQHANLPLALGNVIKGRLSLDTFASPSPFDTNGVSDGFLVYGAVVKSFSFIDSASGFTFNATDVTGGNAIVANNLVSPPVGWDLISLASAGVTDTGATQSASINLFDKTGTAFNSFALPTLLSFNNFHAANVSFSWLDNTTGDQLQFGAELLGFTAVSPVPEPSALVMLVAGVLCLRMLCLKRRNRP